MRDSDYDPLEQSAHKRAAEAHKDQRRKGGDPYILHPRRVADLVRPHVSHAGVAAALLHDVLEDTELKIDDFPLRVQQLVDLLTKRDDEDKTNMIERIGSSRDVEGQLIKLADRYDNLKDARGVFGEKWFKRYLVESMQLLTVTRDDCKGHPIWLQLSTLMCSSAETYNLMSKLVAEFDASWEPSNE